MNKQPNRAQKHHTAGKLLFLAVGCLTLLAMFHFTSLGSTLSYDHTSALRQRLNQTGSWAPAFFVALGAGSLILGLPRSAYCLLGGALFDFWPGVTWCIAGSLAGSLAIFTIARLLGRGWVYRRWGQRYQSLEQRMRSDGFVVILLARLCPATNNLLINGLAGISTVNTGSFLGASLAGFAPSTAILVLMGSGVAVADSTRMVISLALFIIATLCTIQYYRRSGLAGDVWRDLTASK